MSGRASLAAGHITRTRRAGAGLAALAAALLAGCAGGQPLLHPARALPTGDVRASAGLSANGVIGSASDDLARAREIAARDASAPGEPGTSPEYAKGALVAAALAPGLAPVVAARVGVGERFEGGLGYTGRAVRLDARRSFDFGNLSLSAGLGGSAALYGNGSESALDKVDVGALHGWGGDLPLLVGWRSSAGMYQAWGGARAGLETISIERVTSEPRAGFPGPIGLDAFRWWVGGLAGFAIGFRHLHVAAELGVAWQHVKGSYNKTDATVTGVTLTPGTALWWTF